MTRMEIFKKMKNECLNMVHTAMLVYGLYEAEVSVRTRRMKVTVYAGKGAVSMTFYFSGRLILESAENVKNGKFVVESDETYADFWYGKKEIGELIGTLILDLFADAQAMQTRQEKERHQNRERRKAEKKAETETAVSPDESVTEPETTEQERAS